MYTSKLHNSNSTRMCLKLINPMKPPRMLTRPERIRVGGRGQDPRGRGRGQDPRGRGRDPGPSRSRPRPEPSRPRPRPRFFVLTTALIALCFVGRHRGIHPVKASCSNQTEGICTMGMVDYSGLKWKSWIDVNTIHLHLILDIWYLILVSPPAVRLRPVAHLIWRRLVVRVDRLYASNSEVTQTNLIRYTCMGIYSLLA